MQTTAAHDFKGYEFVDFEKIKWTKNQQIMLILETQNEDGKNLALTVSPKYLQKVLNKEEPQVRV